MAKHERGKLVKLIKLKDNKFDGKHPNNINIGFIKIGKFHKEPTIGESFVVGWDFGTSKVIEILEDGVFNTLNSTYKYEIINE